MEMAPRTGLEAARWARGWRGDAAYHNMCKAFVRSSFAIVPSQSNTAIECYREARFKHPLTAATIEDTPYAVPVYFDTGNPAEHVVLAIRRDRQGHRLCVTTDANDGRIGVVRLRDLLRWGPVIGWAEDMDNQRVWTP